MTMTTTTMTGAYSRAGATSILIVGRGSPIIEIDVGSEISALTFTVDGEYLVSGGDGVRVWRVKNGEEVARMEARNVRCLAGSKDGRWIAGGTLWGDLIIWDTTTYEQAFSVKDPGSYGINGVDFSPDSTRVVAASENCTASVWDIALCKQVQTLRHEDAVNTVKFSPHGDRLATATRDCVRVWDSKNGRLLVDISAKLTHTGLLWFSHCLFVTSGSKIKQFDASTGSLVSEWPAPNGDITSCISLSQHGEFITYSTNHAVTFWDASTHAQLGLLQHPQDICSVALSPDRFLAIGRDEKIIFESLSHNFVSVPLDYSVSELLSSFHSAQNSTTFKLFPVYPPSHDTHHTFQEPVIQIDDAALDLWKNDQLENAETLLTAAILESENPSHHVLASRALVRARLQQWDASLVDAETVLVALFSHILTLMLTYTKAIEISPSVIAFLAKSIALVGKGERHKGYRACDIAFEHFHGSHVTFHLLIKVCIVPAWTL